MFGDKAFKEERERRCEWRGGTQSILKNKGPKPLGESKVTSGGGRSSDGWDPMGMKHVLSCQSSLFQGSGAEQLASRAITRQDQ